MKLVVRTLLAGLFRVVRAHPYATAWVAGSFVVGAVDFTRLHEAYMIATGALFLATIPFGIALRLSYDKSPEVRSALGARPFPPVWWPTSVFYFAQRPELTVGRLTAAPARRFTGAFAAPILGVVAAGMAVTLL